MIDLTEILPMGGITLEDCIQRQRSRIFLAWGATRSRINAGGYAVTLRNPIAGRSRELSWSRPQA